MFVFQSEGGSVLRAACSASIPHIMVTKPKGWGPKGGLRVEARKTRGGVRTRPSEFDHFFPHFSLWVFRQSADELSAWRLWGRGYGEGKDGLG